MVRLLRMGYIGGSAQAPQIAFSIRLLRYHHIVWKHCSVRLAPFVSAQDEYLDPGHSLLVNPATNQVRTYSYIEDANLPKSLLASTRASLRVSREGCVN